MEREGLKVVFVDTNVIIEAHRTGCWEALVGSYDVHTVETVAEEAFRGPVDRTGYISIDAEAFDAKVTTHVVSEAMRAKALIDFPQLATIDDGERDLLAFLFCYGRPVVLLSTGDSAAIRCACQLGFKDQLYALEKLARKGSVQRPFKSWYTNKHLDSIKTQWTFDTLT